jgi:hypothetical protein
VSGAYGTVNAVLDTVWRESRAFVGAMKSLSQITQTEALVAKQEPD